MSDKPKLFNVNPSDRKAEDMVEVDFAELGIRERQDIQEWVAKNPNLLGQKLLIISKEFSDFFRSRIRDKNTRCSSLSLDANHWCWLGQSVSSSGSTS